MPKRQVKKPPSSGGSIDISVDSAPPFLPLEESVRSRSDTDTSLEDQENEKSIARKRSKAAHMRSRIPKLSTKRIIQIILGMFFFTILWESLFVDPEDRLIQPDFSDRLLLWVEAHPIWGLGAISLIIAGGVVTMVPIGTPLTIGCGFIYRGVYGWKVGIFVATVVSMFGSLLGAICCFLLGRYLMRETVRRWVRNYPLFDAIDIAASEQGLKIMAMLYLTPVLPLGLVSYMTGTTSMDLYSFSLAKVASVPLYLIYTFMGASAHSFIKRGGKGGAGKEEVSTSEGAKQLEENEFLIVSGIILSVVMMTLITRHIKKELMKILEQQKKEKTASFGEDNAKSFDTDTEDTGVELGLIARRRGPKTEQMDKS